MRRPKHSREARGNPVFAWSAAFLRGGEKMLDAMAAATRGAARVGVLPTDDAPPRRTRRAKPQARKRRKAKARRR